MLNIPSESLPDSESDRRIELKTFEKIDGILAAEALFKACGVLQPVSLWAAIMTTFDIEPFSYAADAG